MRSMTLDPVTAPRSAATDVLGPARAGREQPPRRRDGRYRSDDGGELKDLVFRARGGEADAFGALYDHYVDQIYRYVYHRVGVHALAEDLTSETFLRALRRVTSFTWQGKDFGAWLVTIARNLVTDHFKSGRYRFEVCTAELHDADRYEEGPEPRVLDSITATTLRAAVRELGAEQRECVALRFLAGLSVAETAAAMGKNTGAVKALQYRAMHSLARLLPYDIR